ncbi:formylglycine-generating enzyme family protein [Synechococcus sp. MU1625]|jgi:formylglycine-generating enzyme required for sulfatase activity|uniref:formylglycine-generating enzyme family protein n=1 Tax=Synechococcus sp. MU1625 TaxID=2508347 RepID=UPI001CF8FA0B|nr:formylglycine-generating enzyme family protein [Synechococcus sp. MU1625]MCB4398534.1 formylglycine-generating enzyme family protein [Synechococcus sp. MU1625]
MSNCRDGMIAIPAGDYQVGSDRFYPEEAPIRQVSIDSFQIDHAPVTNAEFLQFVEATGYQTVSERPPDPTLYPDLPPEEQIPESVVFLPPPPTVDRSEPLSWWALIAGADWRHPQGPDTNLDGLMQHPVVHVAFEDALAYADWAGKRLPMADEWEVAARGGLVDQDYAWGADKTPDGRWLANVWQGPFPWDNQETDGWFWTSPVGSFPANGYGLVDVCGNVWEWTSTPYAVPEGEQERRVIKGGSFLCADNYCHRFRPSALMGQTLDTATCHMGFRCAADR